MNRLILFVLIAGCLANGCTNAQTQRIVQSQLTDLFFVKVKKSLTKEG
jgi:hypothetical protein